MELELLYVLAVGLIVGSFLNVCIYRVPRGISVVSPRSRCPHCDRPVAALENIPVVSYLLLRGRCRGCGLPISWVYPAVELLTAFAFAALYLRFGLTPPAFVNALLVSLLIALVFIDLYERILPDAMTLSGALAGFLLAGFQSPDLLLSYGALWPEGGTAAQYLNSLLGILFGGGFLWGVAVLYFKLRKIEGMGFGDIKMMAMVGAFLGWQYAWMTILLGSLIGAIVGGLYIYLLNRGRRYELPFGTFLGLGAFFATLFGPRLLDWYVAHFLGS